MGWLEPLPSVMSACENAGLLITNDGLSTLVVTEFTSPETSVDQIRRGWDLTATLEVSLREVGLVTGRIGVIGAEAFPYAVADEVRRRLPDVVLVPADEISSKMRAHLGDEELPLVRHAAATGARIYEAMITTAEPGVTEGEMVAAGLSVAARTQGCTHWSFLGSLGTPVTRTS